MTRRDVRLTGGYALAFASTHPDAVSVRLLGEVGAESDEMRVDPRLLATLMRPDTQSIEIAEMLTLRAEGGKVVASIGDEERGWVDGLVFAREVWKFLCAARGRDFPLPGSIEAVWECFRRRSPDRIGEDDGRTLVEPTAVYDRGLWVIRAVVRDEHGKPKSGTFTGRSREEAWTFYWRYVRWAMGMRRAK